MSRFTSRPLLLLLVLALALAASATDRPVKDTEKVSEGPKFYGQISVSVDHVSVR